MALIQFWKKKKKMGGVSWNGSGQYSERFLNQKVFRKRILMQPKIEKCFQSLQKLIHPTLNYSSLTGGRPAMHYSKPSMPENILNITEWKSAQSQASSLQTPPLSTGRTLLIGRRLCLLPCVVQIGKAHMSRVQRKSLMKKENKRPVLILYCSLSLTESHYSHSNSWAVLQAGENF